MTSHLVPTLSLTKKKRKDRKCRQRSHYIYKAVNAPLLGHQMNDPVSAAELVDVGPS